MARQMAFASKAVLAFFGFAALFGLGAFMLFAPKFFPAPLTVWAGMTCGALLALAGVILAWRMPIRLRSTHRPRGCLTGMRLWPALMFSVAGFTLASGIVVDLAAFYTRATGTPSERQAMVTGWRQGIKSCDGPDLAGISSFASRLCMARPVPAGTKLSLQGRETIFGFQVTAINGAAQP